MTIHSISKKKNRKSQFYSQRKIWKMARNHDLISLNMIGMTSALIAWLLPFWSKGTYHNFSFNSHASFSLGGLRLLKTYIPENFWDIRKVDDRSGTGYYLSGAIQTCWMNADHRIRFWPKKRFYGNTTTGTGPWTDQCRTDNTKILMSALLTQQFSWSLIWKSIINIQNCRVSNLDYFMNSTIR